MGGKSRGELSKKKSHGPRHDIQDDCDTVLVMVERWHRDFFFCNCCGTQAPESKRCN